MKKLLCKFLGHRWRPMSPDEVNVGIAKGELVLAVCTRCGFHREPVKIPFTKS